MAARHLGTLIGHIAKLVLELPLRLLEKYP
jgi:hypothetical protein